jgi:hypothetical protein
MLYSNSMIDKDHRIISIVTYLQAKYGIDNILVKDHWEGDLTAIGLTDKTKQYLAYISIINDQDDSYFLALENPPVVNTFPYLPGGSFDNISLTELEQRLTKHLRLTP